MENRSGAGVAGIALASKAAECVYHCSIIISRSRNNSCEELYC
jgi:hypothetical protein